MDGLGNQMFQYALGRCLAEKHHTTLKLDTTQLLDRRKPNSARHVHRDYDLGIFNICEEFSTKDEVNTLTYSPFSIVRKVLRKLLKWIIRVPSTYILEKQYHFETHILLLPDNVYLEGYWQTEKYFLPIESIIRQELSFKNELCPQSKILRSEILASESICINVRRTDYLVNTHHGVCGLDYFYEAIGIISKQIKSVNIFVFSDDIEWCQANLKFSYPTTMVSHEYAGLKFNEYLHLMSCCRHFVIPNSTFAWWAAWLSDNPNKIVIAPKKWFNDPKIDTNDLIPSSWQRI